MNNKTKNLIAFAFTAFVFVFATHASAAVTSDDYGTPRYNYNNQPYAQPYMQTYGNQYQYPQQSYNQNYQQPYNQNNGQQYNQNYGSQTGYAAPVNNQPVNNPVVSSNTSTNTSTKNTNTTKTTTVRRVVASNTQAKPVAVSQNQVAGTNVGVISASDINQAQANNLPALSMRGSNTFMPDTVFEWLLTIIFILVIIIIVRLMSKKHGHGDHH